MLLLLKIHNCAYKKSRLHLNSSDHLFKIISFLQTRYECLYVHRINFFIDFKFPWEQTSSSVSLLMSAGLSGNNTGTTQQFSGEESAEFMVMQPDAWFSFIFPTFTALCCLNSQPRVTLKKQEIFLHHLQLASCNSVLFKLKLKLQDGHFCTE